jgi:hypothetical protein
MAATKVGAHPGDLVARDSFFIGKLKGVGPVWQLTAVDAATRWAIGEVFVGPSRQLRGSGRPQSFVASARTSPACPPTNGPELTGLAFSGNLAALGIRHHHTPPRSPKPPRGL